jgi:hypothetical protein
MIKIYISILVNFQVSSFNSLLQMAVSPKNQNISNVKGKVIPLHAIKSKSKVIPLQALVAFGVLVG